MQKLAQRVHAAIYVSEKKHSELFSQVRALAKAIRFDSVFTKKIAFSINIPIRELIVVLVDGVLP
jgi:hypothetical protein